MDFNHSDKVLDLMEQLNAFMDEHVYPNEEAYTNHFKNTDNKWVSPPLMQELKNKAKDAGLWNLFLPESERGAGLSNLEYAKKVEALGADAVIAVNNKAGGHLGPMSPEELIPLLVKNCKIPVISAGGVSDGNQLSKLLDLGAYISLSGIITFNNSRELQKTASLIPFDRLLIETDSPFLAPEPKRGSTNEPSFIKYTAQKMAEIKNNFVQGKMNKAFKTLLIILSGVEAPADIPTVSDI